MNNIVQKDLKGNIIKTFKNATDVVLSGDFNRSNIYKASKGQYYGSHIYKGFIWEISQKGISKRKISQKKIKTLPKVKTPKGTSIKSLPGERWKRIKGFKGYSVSSEGRIKRNGKYEKIIKPFLNKVGYLQASIIDNSGKVRKPYIHRLVAIAFIPNPQGKPEVDHISTQKTMNQRSNLRWCTKKENMANPITRQKMLAHLEDLRGRA